MRTKVHFLTFDEVFATCAPCGFDVQGVPGVANQFLVSKYGAEPSWQKPGNPSEADKKLPHTAVSWRQRPGYLVGGEVAILLDRGLPEILEDQPPRGSGDSGVPAGGPSFCRGTAEVIGEPSLYNESLGTTSDSYLYDRVKGRDLPLAQAACSSMETASLKC